MRPHRTYLITPPYTPIYINDALSETPTSRPTRQATRGPAVLGLVLGLGVAVLVMLGTWLSLSPQVTAGVTTFVMHSEEQTLTADELEDLGIPPAFLEDIFAHF